MFKQSKFKHTTGKEFKRDLWYSDLRVNTTGAGESTAVCCGERYVAVNWACTSGATVALLPLESMGKRRTEPVLLRAHTAGLCDMAFSPFDGTVLATSGEDAAVKLWSLPAAADELASSPALRTPTLSLAGHRRRVDALAFSPVCASLLASASTDKSVRVWDLQHGAAAAELGAGVFGDAVWSVAWDWAGRLLATTCRDRQLRVLDPRAGSEGNFVAMQGKGHDGLKQSKVTWMGRHARLLTTGFDKMNMRQFALWDARDLSRPLAVKSLGSSSGVSVPLYDADTDLFFVAGKGEATVRVYEALPATPAGYQELAPAGSDQLARGACLVPKRALDLMANEVDRVLKATATAVVPVGFYVPRARRIFHEDLFPDTLSTTPAIGIDDWLAGKNNDPVLEKLRPIDEVEEQVVEEQMQAPAQAQKQESAPAKTEEAAGDAPAQKTEKAAAATAKTPAKEQQQQQATASPTPAKKNVPNIVRYTKFRNIAGKPFMRNTHFEELRINPNCGRLVCANAENVAFPWQGPGGRVIVLKLARPGGRVASDTPFLEHGCEIADMAWSPFDDALLATGGEDAHVKLWRIPAAGLAANRRDADIDLAGHYKRVCTVGFHPTAANLLVSSAMDLAVRLWDVAAAEPAVLEIAGQHTDAVTSTAWSYDGRLLATAARDTRLRVFDPRAGPAAVAQTVAHDGAKGFRAVWCGRRDLIATCGFSRSSERAVALWDPRRLDAHIACQRLDTQSGALAASYDADIDLLVVGGRGDGLTRFFEVTAEPPHLHALTEYQTLTASADYDLLPKRALDVRRCEVVEMVRLFGSPPSTVERIAFCVPRTRMEYFQDDIYPPTRAAEPGLAAADWLAGGNTEPRTVSLQPPDMTPLSDAPPVERAPAKYKLLSASERAAQNELTRDEMFDRIYDQMRTKKEDQSVEEKDAEQRAAQAAAGDCAGDDEWDEYE